MAEPWVGTKRKLLLLKILALVTRPGTAQRSSVHASPDSVREILVIELWNIGDVVLTLPFLAQLRAIFPGARVTMLARKHAQEILAGTGLVDEVIVADLGWSAEVPRRRPHAYPWAELLRLRRQLAGRRFDLAFQARRHIREHLVLALSRARWRVGPSLGADAGALTHPIRQDSPATHKVEDWLALLAPFGGPVTVQAPALSISEGERAWAADYLEARGLGSSDQLIGVHPGGSVAEKRWPLRSFEELAQILSRAPNVRVISFTDPAGYGSSLARIPGVIGAAVGLRQMMALLARCRLLVCNDSGPMHLAAGLGVPCVAVFGTGLSGWFAPIGTGHQIVSSRASAGLTARAPLGYEGIEDVTVQEVLEAIGRVRSSSTSLGTEAFGSHR